VFDQAAGQGPAAAGIRIFPAFTALIDGGVIIKIVVGHVQGDVIERNAQHREKEKPSVHETGLHPGADRPQDSRKKTGGNKMIAKRNPPDTERFSLGSGKRPGIGNGNG